MLPFRSPKSITGGAGDWAINEWWAEHPANASYPDSFLADYVRVYEVEVDQNTSSFRQDEQTKGFSLSPNPVQGEISLSWDSDYTEKVSRVSVLNLSGQTIKTFMDVQENTELAVDELSSGIYFLALRKAQTTEYLKFMKE